jgi:hypothetical protein
MDEPCKHEHWQVGGANAVGAGTCLDCGRQLSLAVLFDGLRQRMEAAANGMKEKVYELENHLAAHSRRIHQLEQANERLRARLGSTN